MPKSTTDWCVWYVGGYKHFILKGCENISHREAKEKINSCVDYWVRQGCNKTASRRLYKLLPAGQTPSEKGGK